MTLHGLVLTACAQFQAQNSPIWTVKVVEEYPHDPAAFTQGLVIEKGQMYEGTGQKGTSELRKVDHTSGNVLSSQRLKQEYFGEGITILDGKIYQITWQNHLGIIYDLETMKLEKTFSYAGEGWGITNDGKSLIMSDGTFNVRFIDPKTLKETKKIQVWEGNKKNRIIHLNELEYVDGEIWANIWYEDRIARISPKTGQVLGWIDMRNLIPAANRDREAVLNGIAYDAESKKIYVTGKNWPKLFQVEIVK